MADQERLAEAKREIQEAGEASRQRIREAHDATREEKGWKPQNPFNNILSLNILSLAVKNGKSGLPPKN